MFDLEEFADQLAEAAIQTELSKLWQNPIKAEIRRKWNRMTPKQKGAFRRLADREGLSNTMDDLNLR